MDEYKARQIILFYKSHRDWSFPDVESVVDDCCVTAVELARGIVEPSPGPG